MARRRLDAPVFIDPLGQDWADMKAWMDGNKQAEISAFNMREFDRQPRAVRLVEHAVGNVGIARQLVSRGITTAEDAEPVVRRMLEKRWGTG